MLGIPAFTETNNLTIALAKSLGLTLTFVLGMYLILIVHHKRSRFFKVSISLLLIAAIMGGGSVLSYEFFSILSQLVENQLLVSVFKWSGIITATILYLGYIVFAANIWRNGITSGYFRGLVYTLILEGLLILTSHFLGWSMFTC